MPAPARKKPKIARTPRVWTLYVIEAENGFLYTGITKDLERRLREHGSGRKAAKFFRRSPPKRVLATIGGLTQSAALRLEYAVKKLDRESKLDFVHLMNQTKGPNP